MLKWVDYEELHRCKICKELVSKIDEADGKQDFALSREYFLDWYDHFIEGCGILDDEKHYDRNQEYFVSAIDLMYDRGLLVDVPKRVLRKEYPSLLKFKERNRTDRDRHIIDRILNRIDTNNIGDDTNDKEEEDFENDHDNYIPLNTIFFSMREVDWMRNIVGLASMDNKTPYVEYTLSQQDKIYLEGEMKHRIESNPSLMRKIVSMDRKTPVERDYYILDKECDEQVYNEWMKKERFKPSDIVIGKRPRRKSDKFPDGGV